MTDQQRLFPNPDGNPDLRSASSVGHSRPFAMIPEGLEQPNSLANIHHHPHHHQEQQRHRSLVRINTIKAMVPFWAEALVDVGSALTASMVVAPILMTFDQAVTQSAAGVTTLGRALADGFQKMIVRPHHVVTSAPYWMIVGVYGTTYAAANLIDSSCEHFLDQQNENEVIIHSWSKVAITTAVNMTVSIAKDAAFARMYGSNANTNANANANANGKSSAKTPRVPLQSYGFFAARDVITIGAAFVVPQLVAGALLDHKILDDEAHASECAQMITPVAAQLVCTPLHLLALHRYYHPRTQSLGRRLGSFGPLVPATTVARMCRMLPAFGIGGVLNTKLTMEGRECLMERYHHAHEYAEQKRLRRQELLRRRGSVAARTNFDHKPVTARRMSVSS